MKKELSIIIATFNEEKNIEYLFNKIKKNLNKKLVWEIIFIDDESLDNTVKEINKIKKENSNVKLIKRYGVKGLSSALIQGAMASNSRYIIFMDADLQHDPIYILPLYNEIKRTNYNIVLASRFLNNKNLHNYEFRYKLSILINRIINKTFGLKLSDSLTGFFILEKNFFDNQSSLLTKKSFKLLLDIILSSRLKKGIGEISFNFQKRNWGKSKLNIKVIIDFLILIFIHLKRRILLNKNKL